MCGLRGKYQHCVTATILVIEFEQQHERNSLSVHSLSSLILCWSGADDYCWYCVVPLRLFVVRAMMSLHCWFNPIQAYDNLIVPHIYFRIQNIWKTNSRYLLRQCILLIAVRLKMWVSVELYYISWECYIRNMEHTTKCCFISYTTIFRSCRSFWLIETMCYSSKTGNVQKCISWFLMRSDWNPYWFVLYLSQRSSLGIVLIYDSAQILGNGLTSSKRNWYIILLIDWLLSNMDISVSDKYNFVIFHTVIQTLTI